MIEKSEYKGKPILILKRNEEDKFPFHLVWEKLN
jgi:hypothetical protein